MSKQPIRLGTGRSATVRDILGEPYKFCPDCDGWLPLTEFYLNRGGSSGYCRTHHSARSNPRTREQGSAMTPEEELAAIKRIGEHI